MRKMRKLELTDREFKYLCMLVKSHGYDCIGAKKKVPVENHNLINKLSEIAE